MKKYLKEMRVSHWLKNGILFLPAFFGGNIFNPETLIQLMLGFCAFSFMSSAIYIINDINDIEKDKLHPEKRKRPIAAGLISVRKAVIMAVFLAVLAVCCVALAVIYGSSIFSFVVLIAYLFINLLYSVWGFKNKVLIDVIMLASGFVLRAYMGSVITGVNMSSWLYLVVVLGSFYLGFGKRRNELLSSGEKTRKVLKKYTPSYLGNMMNICMGMALVFFSLWCKEKDDMAGGNKFVLLVPFMIIICFRYNYLLECADSSGDPMEVILKDKFILILAAIMGCACVFMIY